MSPPDCQVQELNPLVSFVHYHTPSTSSRHTAGTQLIISWTPSLNNWARTQWSTVTEHTTVEEFIDSFASQMQNLR